MIQYKDLLCETKYLIDTKDYFYQTKPDGNISVPWELHGYSDADYAGYNGTRKSVTGYIVLINGSVIAWRLQSQEKVTLSITESEYSAIAEVCFEILSIRVILLSMGVVV